MFPASDHWVKQNTISRIMGEYFIWPKSKQDLFQRKESSYWKKPVEYFIEFKSCKPGMIFSVLSGFSHLPKSSSPVYKGNPKPCDNHTPWNIKLKVNSTFDLHILDSFRFSSYPRIWDSSQEFYRMECVVVVTAASMLLFVQKELADMYHL